MSKAPKVERPYETLFICTVETPQKNVEALIEKVKAALTAEKSTVRTVQYWGRRRLTYPIKRQKDGVYVYFDFDGNNKAVEVINTIFHVTDFVVRHMTVLREDAPVIPVATPVASISEATPEAAPSAAAAAPESPSIK
jgi:small subunit ribosomal protein S6